MSQVQVLMPVRDAAATVERAARSILAQTLRELTLVAVDDGSTDATAVVLERLAREDARVRVFRRPREGLVPALNYGLAHCPGPFVARMDGDDWSAPERLRRQVDLLGTGLDVVGTRVRIVGGGAGFERYARWQNRLVDHAAICRELFVESPLAHPTLMFRRDVLQALGGYHDPAWPEDYDLLLRAHARGARFGKTPQILVDWHDHPARASRVQERYRERAFLECKAHYLRALLFSATGSGKRRCVLWGAGKIGKRLGRGLLDRGVEIVHYVDIDPAKIGRTRRGLPVTSPDTLHPQPDTILIAAVGAAGARPLIREHARALGFREGTDFFCAA